MNERKKKTTNKSVDKMLPTNVAKNAHYSATVCMDLPLQYSTVQNVAHLMTAGCPTTKDTAPNPSPPSTWVTAGAAGGGRGGALAAADPKPCDDRDNSAYWTALTSRSSTPKTEAHLDGPDTPNEKPRALCLCESPFIRCTLSFS